MKFAQWVTEQALTTDTIDPAAPLDDLEPLRELIGSARVVAIGESAHDVHEFHLVRHRLLRFLVERCGFTVYAFEAPFVASEAVDTWTRGGPGDLAELTATPAMELLRSQEMRRTLTWIRQHNATARRPVRFAGTLAGDGGGSPLPELQRVADHLRRADPDALPLLERALATARRYHDPSPLAAMNAYATLDPPARDALTADLSRLLARTESMTAHPAEGGHAAMTYLRGAWLVDHLHRDLNGHGLAVGTTALDTFMAESVLRRLETEPDARIVLALHNVHLRAAAVEHDGPAGLLPAGYRLRAALGGDYLAMAVTGSRGSVMSMTLDSGEVSGFALTERELPPDEAGSVESAFAADAALTIADLRAARSRIDDAHTFQSFREQDYFLGVPVFDALDAVAYLPRLRPVTRA